MALSDNLVAYWKLDNVNDSVGSINLTNNNTATFVSGKLGNCVNVVRASSQSLSSTNDLGITNGSFTFSAWIYAATLPSSGQVYTISTLYDTGTFVGWRCYLINNGGSQEVRFARLKDNVAEDTVTVTTTLTTATWYHYVITYDGSNVRGYLNNTAYGPTASSGNGTAPAKTEGFKLGDSVYASQFYDGRIDEVGVWSRALSVSEVSELYNSGTGITYPFSASSADNSLFFGGGF